MLLVLLVVVLVSILAVSLTGFVDEGEDAMELHATGTFDFDVKPDDTVHLRPETFDRNDATLQLQINGFRVHEWNGRTPVELTCLYPGDQLTVVSVQDDTTAIVDQETLKESTKCTRISRLPKKFRYAYVDYKSTSKRVRIADGFPFTLGIDPDGPGEDTDYTSAVHRKKVATIPFTNPWHYYKRYERGIGPFDEGPVWVIVMVDNVHWAAGSSYSFASSGVTCCNSQNWTDPPPSGIDPGSNSYTTSGGKIDPVPSGTEPTNDVYMLFKPRCASEGDHGTLAVMTVTAGYQNDIYFNGKKVIDDTSKWNIGSSGTADGDIEASFEVEPRSC